MITYDQFFNQWNGHFADFDGAYGNQCFDLFQFYNRDVVGGGFVSGNGAADIWTTYPKNLYTQVPNTPTGIPPKGAVMIWKGSYNGGPGHVGIVTGRADVNTFDCFEQNDPTGSNCHVRTYNYNSVFGWLTPKNASTPPTAPLDPKTALQQIKAVAYGAQTDSQKVVAVKAIISQATI